MGRRRFVALVAFGCATSLTACGGCNTPEDPDATVGPLEIDGLLLVDNGYPPPALPIVLFDPRTGAVSATSLPRTFALAPDLKRVAYRSEDGHLLLATIGIDGAGTPAFTTVDAVAEEPGLAPLAFNAQGDRVIAATYTWDLAADEVLRRSGTMSPDGRHQAAGVLYDDRAQPMALPFEAPVGGFSSDGQWAIASDRTQDLSKLVLAHVPTRSIPQHFTSVRLGWDLPRDPKSGRSIAYAGSDGRARLVFTRGGRHGQVFEIYPCGSFGEATCFDIKDSPVSVVPITRIRPGALVEAAPDATETTPLTALEAVPLPPDAHGFEWSVIAISPDDERAIVQYRPYRIVVLEPETNVPSYVYLSLSLFSVELGGDGTLTELVSLGADEGAIGQVVGFACAPYEPVSQTSPLYPTDADRLRLSSHVRFLDEHDFVCASDSNPATLAYVGGEARVLPRPGDLATLDGADLLGVGPVDADGLCQRAIAGGPLRCTPTPISFTERPVAQVGIDLVPRTSSGPVVTALSHRAAVPGTTVRVLGYGFGTTGTLRIGDVVIAASDITSWTDTAIAFAFPSGAPPNGAVHVTSAGTTSKQRHLWIGRAEPWTGAPVIPFTPVAIQQGMSRIAFPGAGAYAATMRGLDQIFTHEPITLRGEAAGPDHLDAMVLATPPAGRFLWVTFETPKVHVYRPLELTAGLPSTPPWQPIAQASLPSTAHRFHVTGGKLVLWDAIAPVLYVRTFATAGADWQLAVFSTFPSFPRMPNLMTAALDGDEMWAIPLRRRTGWGELDAGMLYPIYTDAPTPPFAVNSIGVRGQVIAVQLQETSSPVSHSTHVSTNGGASFVQVVAALPNHTGRWGAAVDGTRPGIYGSMFDGATQSLARVSDTGAFTGGIGPALPPGVPQCAGGYFGYRGWLLCHDQSVGRLFALDTSVAAGAVWSELGGARAGHLTAAYVDRPNDRLLVGSDTGEIVASTDLGAWTVLDDVALGPIAVDLRVEALGVLPGGHLVAVVIGQGWSQSLVVVRSPP